MKFLRKFNNVSEFNNQKGYLYSLEELQNTVVCGIKNNSEVVNDIRYINTNKPSEVPVFVKVAHFGHLTGSNGFVIFVIFPKMNNITIEGTITLSVMINSTKKIYHRSTGNDVNCTINYDQFSLENVTGYTLENGEIPWDLYESGDITNMANSTNGGNISDMFSSTAYQNMNIELNMTAKWHSHNYEDWFNIPVVLYSEKDL